MISSWQLRLSQMAGQPKGQQRNSECLSLLCTIEFLVVLHLVPKVALLGIWQMDQRGEGTDQLLSGLCQDWIRLFKEASDILGKRNCCQEDRHKAWQLPQGGGIPSRKVTHNWLCELQSQLAYSRAVARDPELRTTLTFWRRLSGRMAFWISQHSCLTAMKVASTWTTSLVSW